MLIANIATTTPKRTPNNRNINISIVCLFVWKKQKEEMKVFLDLLPNKNAVDRKEIYIICFTLCRSHVFCLCPFLFIWTICFYTHTHTSHRTFFDVPCKYKRYYRCDDCNAPIHFMLLRKHRLKAKTAAKMEGTTDKKQQQQQSWKSDWLTWHFGTLFLLLHEQHLFFFFEPGYRNECE